MMADLSPETTGMIISALVGLLLKAGWDSSVRIFQNTLDTPKKLAALSDLVSRELTEMKLREGIRDQNITRNWEKFHELEKEVIALEGRDE